MTEPLVLLVVGFLLTSGIGGALGYFFQQRAWRHQYRAGRDDHLREQALKTFEEVSTLLDQRLYRMRRVYWAAKRRASNTTKNNVLNAELDDYRSVLRSWNDNLNRILALVNTYFGHAARQYLEFKLYVAYAAIGEELDELVREVSTLRDDPVAIRPMGSRFAQLSRDVYQFNVVLLRSLRDGQLGSSAPTAIAIARGTERADVRFGEQGDDVLRLQRALQRAGATDLVADGHFGRNTDKALREIQRSLGVVADGIPGPMTREALGVPSLRADASDGPDLQTPPADC